GVISRRRHRLAAELPFAEHHVRARPGGGIQQPHGFLGAVLQVAVEQQDVGGIPLERCRQSGTDRVSLPAVLRMTQDLGTGGLRQAGRMVRGAVVHDQDAGDGEADAAHDGGDGRGLVAGRDDGGRPDCHARRPSWRSAGSTSTDAAASATTLTAETRPIERSGGYDEFTSVPYPSSVIAPATRITGASSAVACAASPRSL